MKALENGKHELFAQKWHELDNKSEAYRLSHPASKTWKDATIHNKASALARNDEVLARYDFLRSEAMKAHGVTIKSLLKELDENRQAALQAETPQSSAATSATMAKAKLVGLDIVKIDHQSSDGSMSPVSLTPEQAEKVRQEMLAQDDC